MAHLPLDGEVRRSTVPTRRHQTGAALSIARASQQTSPDQVAVRVAAGMMRRYGTDAVREATAHLNKMIDRGDIAARDLWACVVHVIHERRA